MTKYVGTVVVAALGLGAVACGGAHAGRGIEFPSQASLSELANAPEAPDKGNGQKTVAVDDWTPGDAVAPTTEAEALAQRTAQAKHLALTIDAELGCVAREVARFYAEHQAFPDQQLQQYMAGVCGATQPSFGVTVWSTPTETVTDSARQKEWHDAIGKQLAGWLPASAKQLGAAELAAGKNSVFAVTVGSSDVVWENKSPIANADGVVELSGSLRTPAAFVFGSSDVGQNGQRDCHWDPRVALPRFHISCQLDPADTSAWVDLSALPPGHVLAHGIARILVRREGTALGFSAPTKNLPPENVTKASDFAKRLLALINERRAQAQLPALQLATRESETSARLASHYFGSDRAEDLGDQIALGLMAGWDIQGNTIRNGDFFSNELSGSLDPRRWLGFMLEQPSARRVLLDPAARAIAIGPSVHAQSQTVGALVTTYSFYTSDDHHADIERFVTRLNERRQGLGLAPAKLTPAPEVAKAVRAVSTTHDPNAALQDAMQQVVARSQKGVEGYYIEATDLDHVTLPEALLRPQVNLAISAAHHRYPDAAWGTLTLLVVVLDSSGESHSAHQTARGAVRQSVQ